VVERVLDRPVDRWPPVTREGVPGIAKTLLVQSVGKAIDLQFKRVQFTIDLLPSGTFLGSEILDQKTRPISHSQRSGFHQPVARRRDQPRFHEVQSALLEAMQERKVSIGDETHTLPAPFLGDRHANPVEQAGTFETARGATRPYSVDVPRLRYRLRWGNRVVRRPCPGN